MKVQFIIPADCPDVTVHKDDNDRVTAISVEPKFLEKKAKAIVASVVSTNSAGDVLDAFDLLASGTNGSVKRSNHVGGKVVPACDEPKSDD